MAKRAPKTIHPLDEEQEQQYAVVINDEPEEAPQSVLDNLKSTALQVVSITESTIQQIEERYATFQIDGDQKQYKEAKQVKNRLVKLRTAIDRKRIATNKAFTEATNAQCKAVTDRTIQVENHLLTECSDFENAERIRVEARRQHVIDSLIGAGFKFNGIAYECGSQTVWQTEVDSLTDAQLDGYVDFGNTWTTEEAARIAADRIANEDVYLHHEKSNEILTVKRGEFDAQAYAESGVIEITKDQYNAIQQAKLNAFKRPVIAKREPIPVPEPPMQVNGGGVDTPMPAVTSRTPSIAERFASAPSPAWQQTAVPTMQAVLDEYDQGFNAGYEAYRSQIIAAFQNPALSYKRAEWIEYFKALTAIPTI